MFSIQSKGFSALTHQMLIIKLCPALPGTRCFSKSTSHSCKGKLKCCTQYASKYGKLSSGHRTGKCQFSFQSQRKAMPKNAQTTTQLHSFTCQQSNGQNSPSQASTVHEPCMNFQIFKLDLEKTGTRDQFANSYWIIKTAREFQKNFCFIDYIKAFDCVVTTNCGKFRKRWEYQTT